MGGFRGLELRRAAAVVHSTVAALPGSGPLGQLALLSATARPLSENPPCSCTSSLALDLVKKCLKHQIYFPVFKKVLNPVSSFKLKNKFCSGPLFFLRSCVGTIVQIQVVFLPWVQRGSGGGAPRVGARCRFDTHHVNTLPQIKKNRTSPYGAALGGAAPRQRACWWSASRWAPPPWRNQPRSTQERCPVGANDVGRVVWFAGLLLSLQTKKTTTRTCSTGASGFIARSHWEVMLRAVLVQCNPVAGETHWG